METQDTFTYEAEILPEIEIRELVSFDELVATMPSFVAFTEDEILHHLTQLVEDKHKASVFQTIYDAIRNHVATHPEHVVPILTTRVAEVTDEALQKQLLPALERTNRAPNYQSQMDEIYKITYPLEKTAGSYVPIVPVTVGLEGDVKKRFVLLPKDQIPQRLHGIAYRIQYVTSASYIHERANVHSIPPFPTTEDIIEGKTVDEAEIPFQGVCDLLTDILDTHGLRVHFSRFGYDFDALTEDQITVLVAKLATLSVDKEVAENVATNPADDQAPFTSITRKNMWDAYAQASERPIEMEKYMAAWQSLTTSMQLSTPAVDVPSDVLAIVEGLGENKFTLDDVIANLRYKRSLAEFTTLRSFLDNVQATSQNDIQAMLEQERSRWAMIYDSYVDRVNREFVETYKDMAEIKEGRDEATYIGDVENVLFEEQANQIIEAVDIDTDEDDAVDGSSLVADVDGISIYLTGLSAGCREVLEIVLPKIVKLKNLSGLPLDIEALVAYISSNVVRISRAEYIHASVPTLAVHQRNQLLSMDMERALHMTTFMTPTYIIPPLKEALQTSWKALETDAKNVFFIALAWWVLDIQQKALARDLAFDTMQGFLPCIRKFSPWGPPISSDKGEGVLEYIVCIAKESQLWSFSTEELKLQIMKLWDGDERVDSMKVKYKELGKHVMTMNERAKAANLSLAEAIANKQKQRYLSEYVKAYMLLPGLLASHQPKVNYGCCLQKIGENFRADSDWRDILKRVRDIKDAYAKKRMTMADMPSYMLYTRPVTLMETSDVTNTVTSLALDVPTLFSIEEWLDQWSSLNLSFITPDMVAAAYTDINKTVTLSQKFLDMASTTASTRIPQMHEFLQEKASWSNFDQMLNVILATLHREKATYADDAVERQALDTSITEMIRVKHHMQKLKGVFGDVEYTFVRPLYAYVISRAVCLPSVPEASKTKRLVLTGTYNTNFLTKTVKASLDALKQFMSVKKMPTLEEQKDFITNVREQQKVEVLDILDNKSVDDRHLLLEAKKLGLVKLTQAPTGTSFEEEEKKRQEMEDQEALDEFKYKGVDQDQNDVDNLDDE